MCGLVGLFGQIDSRAKKAFNILHHLDVLRGRDGAGIFYANFKGQGELIKCGGLPDDLHWYYHDKFDEKNHLKENNLMLVMGHNRWKTMGAVSDANAHPFEFDRIVGAHNGTVSKYHLKDFPDFGNEEVDSRILFSGINAWTKGELDKHESFQDIINTVYGAMALTWWDKQKRILHMYRNSQRDLYYTCTKDESLILWASEDWMLKVATDRANIPINDILKYPEYKHSQFKVKCKGNKIKVRLHEHQEVKKVYSSSSSNRSGYVDYGRWNNLTDPHDFDEAAYMEWLNSRSNGYVGPKTPSTSNNVVRPPFVNNNKEPKYMVFNEQISVREFEHRVNLGCVLCGSGLTFADRLEIKWFDKTTPVCSECQSGAILEFKSPDEVARLEMGKDV